MIRILAAGEPHPELFPMDRFWWLYALFILLILGSLMIDLRSKRGRTEAIGHREALLNAGAWIVMALLFCLGIYLFGLHEFPTDPRLQGYDHRELASRSAIEFLSGWLMEKSLSVDNLFVFLIVFQSFSIRPENRHRVLFYGILGALVFRALFIAAGAMVMRIDWVPVVLGVFLLVTGFRVAFGPEPPPDPHKNLLLRLLTRFFPVTPIQRDGKFLIREAGRLAATPLLLALVVIEFTDILFAIDSVPAVFGITREPFIVFTSNVFAILGLRSLYFLLEGMAARFHLLKYGLGFILVFVGLKMAWLEHHLPDGVPTVASLIVIVAALGTAVLMSWWYPLRKPVAR